jgi:hypothetical protein
MDDVPKGIPILFGAVMVLMGSIILGALLGVVPTDGGQFLAPPFVLTSLGVLLIAGGVALWLPRHSPVWIRSALILLALGLLAIVCNWTAFAPEVVYYSSASIGPVTTGGEDPVGGRLVFGLAAIAVDVFILSILLGWIRSVMKSE